MVGDILHLGLQGYGVVRKDLSTGEILAPTAAIEVAFSQPTKFTP